MKTSKLLYLLSGVILATFLIYSCKDDFSEKDFLDYQAQQAATNHQFNMDEIILQAQLARSSDSALATLQNMLNQEVFLMQDSVKYKAQLQQLRNAGLLLSWTIQIQEDRKPLDSVQVDIATADLDNARTLSGVTDANGYVTFMDVTVGKNLLRLSKSGYMSANAIVEFSPNDYTSVYSGDAYNFVALRRQESTILPIFSNSSTATATIKGNVTADIDLTNDAAEPAPLGTTVRADISETLQNNDLIWPTTDADQLDYTQLVQQYSVEGGPNVGVGTVDTAGNYTIIVPTISSGFDVSIIWQNFQHTVKQAVRWDEANGKPLATAAYVDVPRFFGPGSGYYNETAPVQFVPGAWATFPAPTGGGSGFAMTFTAQGRDLGTWTQGTASDGPDNINSNEDGFTQSNVQYRLSDGGTGFTTAAPVISITGGGATTNATMIANMIGRINSINITNGGDYNIADTPLLEVYVIINGDTFQLAVLQLPAVAADGDPLTTGVLDPTTLVNIFDGSNVGVANANGFDDTPWGFGDDDFYTTEISGFTYDATFTPTANFVTFPANEGVITGIIIRATGATTTDAVATLSASMEIASLTMTGGGAGYTSAPTISATGGTTAPVILVGRFATQYVAAVDNTATSAYTILPDVEIFVQAFAAAPNSLSWGENNTVAFTVTNTGQNESDDVNNKLVIDGSGNIQFYDAYTYITVSSVGVPYALVKEIPTTQASAFVWVNTQGQVNTSGTALAQWDNGTGYTAPFGVTITPTVAGAPGSGAVVELLDFTTYSSGEVQWSGNYKVTNGGSGYLQSLNFPLGPYIDALFSGQLTELTRSDVEYSIFVMDGREANLPTDITVFPGDTYEVNGYYGSGYLGQGKTFDPSNGSGTVFPGFTD